MFLNAWTLSPQCGTCTCVLPDVSRGLLILADLQLHIGPRLVLDLASSYYGERDSALLYCLLTLGVLQHSLLTSKQGSKTDALRLVDPCKAKQPVLCQKHKRCLQMSKVHAYMTCRRGFAAVAHMSASSDAYVSCMHGNQLHCPLKVTAACIDHSWLQCGSSDSTCLLRITEQYGPLAVEQQRSEEPPACQGRSPLWHLAGPCRRLFDLLHQAQYIDLHDSWKLVCMLCMSGYNSCCCLGSL